MPDHWTAAPMIYRQVVACPVCGCDRKPVIVRTQPRGTDGAFSRRCVCRRCGSRFLVVFEPAEESLPETGSDATWPL